MRHVVAALRWHNMAGKSNQIKGLYTKRGWYYYQPPTPKNGSGARPQAIALGTQNLVDAITILEEKRDELQAWQAARRMTMDEVLPRYFKEKSSDSDKSVRQREMVLNSFSEILGNPRVDAVTPEVIERWRAHVLIHGANPEVDRVKLARNGRRVKPKLVSRRSDATLKTYTIVVKAFFNWAVRHKIISTSPVIRLGRQTRVAKTKLNDFLSVQEREAAMAADAQEHLRFIIHFGFLAGLRDGEMLAMTSDWLWISPDWTRGTVTVKDQKVTYANGSRGVWRPKTREMRSIPLHPRILEFLKVYGMKSPWMLAPEKAAWPDPGSRSKRFDCHKSLATLAKKNGIRKLNYHIMRHTFATHLAMNGVSLSDIAGLLGDSLKVTEDNYAGYSPSKSNPVALL